MGGAILWQRYTDAVFLSEQHEHEDTHTRPGIQGASSTYENNQ